MIGLNETNEYAAEVVIKLPLRNDPTQGLIGHSWHNAGSGRTDEFQYRLPGGSWQNATISKIVEKGYGVYALRLQTGETSVAGVVWARAQDLAGLAQPCFTTDMITELGGDLSVGSTGYIPFFLADATNPVLGAPLDSHTFTAGEVRVCLPDSTYADAHIADITNFGSGSYGLLLRASDGATALAGKVFIHVAASGAFPFDDSLTILGLGAVPVPTPPTPTPVVPSTNRSGYTITAEDHVVRGVFRLCYQFRFTKGETP